MNKDKQVEQPQVNKNEEPKAVKAEETKQANGTDIQYVNEDAKKVKFTQDPKAKQTIVKSNGIVTHNY